MSGASPAVAAGFAAGPVSGDRWYLQAPWSWSGYRSRGPRCPAEPVLHAKLTWPGWHLAARPPLLACARGVVDIRSMGVAPACGRNCAHLLSRAGAWRSKGSPAGWSDAVHALPVGCWMVMFLAI